MNNIYNVFKNSWEWVVDGEQGRATYPLNYSEKVVREVYKRGIKLYKLNVEEKHILIDCIESDKELPNIF